MPDFDFGGLFGGLAGIVSTAITNDANAIQAHKNRDLQREQFAQDYEHFLENRGATWNREDALRQQQWNREDAIRNELYGREDTSYMRSVADAKAAGLSPLAVNQLSAAGNPVVSSGSGTSSFAPPVHTQTPASYMFQSPAQDISTLIGAVASQKNIDELHRHNVATETQAQRELEFQTQKTNAELLQQASQFDENMKFQREQAETQSSQFMLTYEQNASQFTARLAQDIQFHLDDLRGRALDRALNDMHSINQQNIDSGRDFAKSLNMKYVLKYYTNDDDYNRAMSDLKNIMIRGNRDVTNDIEANPDKYLSVDSSSHSESENNGVSASLGGSANNSHSQDTGGRQETTSSTQRDKRGSLTDTFTQTAKNVFSDTVGKALNASASAQKGSSQSDSYTLSKSDRALAEEVAKKYGSVIEIPVRVYDWKDYEKHYSNYR